MTSSVQTQMGSLKCSICWKHVHYSLGEMMFLTTVCFAKDFTGTESLLLQSALMNMYFFFKRFGISVA